MADEPKSEESERGKKLRRIITGPVTEDAWDAEMRAKGAWVDQTMSLRDRANEKQRQLLADREMARNEYKLLKARLEYLDIHTQNLTFMIHNFDEFIDQILVQAKPEEAKTSKEDI